MTGRPEILAVIPARGGSKGLPRKNLLDLGGLPLVAWSIRAALAAERVTRVVVSTDDEEIATVAREHGAEAPFLRPVELAGDRSNIQHAVDHVLHRLRADEDYEPEAFCVLYPTHPFRPPGLVDLLTRKILENETKVVTARRLSPGPGQWSMPGQKGRVFLDPALPASGPGLYRPYGLFEGKPVKKPSPLWLLHQVDDPVQLIDIDTVEDLALANAALQAGLFPRKEPS